MKKAYRKPVIQVLSVAMAWPVAASGVSSDNGINYGGVDEEGTKDPAARRRRDVWEDDADE